MAIRCWRNWRLFVRSRKGRTLGLSLGGNTTTTRKTSDQLPEGMVSAEKIAPRSILPMNMAADEPGGCEDIMNIMSEFLSAYSGLAMK